MNNKPFVRLHLQQVNAGKHSFSNNPLICSITLQQSGAVLIISLIMLLLLTLIGASSMQTTSLEEKMAGNLRDRNLAFQAAESALKAAEASLDLPNTRSPTAAGTVVFYLDYDPANPNPPASDILTDSFWRTQPTALSSVTTLGNGILTPSYIIQKIPGVCPCPAPDLFRISVRASGASTNTVVILQSVYSPT